MVGCVYYKLWWPGSELWPVVAGGAPVYCDTLVAPVLLRYWSVWVYGSQPPGGSQSRS